MVERLIERLAECKRGTRRDWRSGRTTRSDAARIHGHCHQARAHRHGRMRASWVILALLPAIGAAAEGDGSSRYSEPPASEPGTQGPVGRPMEVARPKPRELPLDVNRSPTIWRLDLGYGQTSAGVHYKATATPDSPTLGGYATVSSSATASTTLPSGRMDIQRLEGVHPSSRGWASGFLWGFDLGLADFAAKTVNLPASDADTSSTSQNGTTFGSRQEIQTIVLSMPVGWAWDLTPRLSLETTGSIGLGVLHAKYTSGENLVYGKGAPLDLFSNDLFNVYGEIGAHARLGYRLMSGFELSLSAGYIYGMSLSGTTRDAVTYYQGGGNAQTGRYQETLSYRISGPTGSLGFGYSF